MLMGMLVRVAMGVFMSMMMLMLGFVMITHNKEVYC